MTSSAFKSFSTTLLPVLVTAATLASVPAADRQYDASTFEWKPEMAPEGPVVVTVSLSTQTAHVYRNGVRIGRCLVSTGKPGHETPTGVFHILNKDADHHSKTYGNAAMPFSERLTWDGVALHAGSLPGYPSSHGCIHLPYEFSKRLFGVTHVGATVVVTDGKVAPYVSAGHGMPAKGGDGGLFKGATVASSWHPEKADEGPVSIIVSEADEKMYVLRNGVAIGESTVAATRKGKGIAGTHAFHLLTLTNSPADAGNPGQMGSMWARIGGSSKEHGVKLDDYFHLPPVFAKSLSTVLHPGTTLVVTDEAVTSASRSKPGFTIVASQSIIAEDQGKGKK